MIKLEDIGELINEKDINVVNEKLKNGWILLDIKKQSEKMPFSIGELILDYGYKLNQIKEVSYRPPQTFYLLGKLK